MISQFTNSIRFDFKIITCSIFVVFYDKNHEKNIFSSLLDDIYSFFNKKDKMLEVPYGSTTVPPLCKGPAPPAKARS